MHNWASYISDVVLLLILPWLIGFLFFFTWRGRTRWTRLWKISKKQMELLEQQVAVLRQTNELLKKLVESTGSGRQ